MKSPIRQRFRDCMLGWLVASYWMMVPCSGFLAQAAHSQSSQWPTCTSNSGTTCLCASTKKNIFHEYNKPIVLIGCSSSSRELSRLGQALASNRFGSQTSAVVTLEASDNVEKVSRKFQWPDILLLDLAEMDASDGPTQISSMARDLYEQNILAVYVNVHKDQLGDNLAVTKAQLDESVFVKFSDYEICIRDEGSKTEDWDHIEWELVRLLARARLVPAIPGDKEQTANSAHLTMGEHTFFLSLSDPKIESVEPFVKQMCEDVDAMEYRADLLKCRDNRFDLIYGMQTLRRYCRPHAVRNPALPFGQTVLEDVVPIVYTVRTQNQAGTYPDDERGIQKMFQLLQWGLRGGVEVLDVESAWDPSQTSALLDLAEERYSSQILGSEHVVGKQIATEEAVGLFQQCAFNGRAHGAKVVLSIESDESDRMAYEAALITSELASSSGEPVIPNISLILGEVGQFSRIINFPFTPVTHESLPRVAAPGQLTSNEIMTTRLLTGLFQPKKYCILGHNIAYSVSPQMQGAAFQATKLPHQYGRFDVETVEEFVDSDFFKSDDFGGASVTIPHKQTIIPFVDELSEAAKAIGSVNTLIVKTEFENDDFKRKIFGDNTDWKGIFNPLNRLLGGVADPQTDYCLIVGAGGTARAAAYVASKLGLRRVYYNRTPSKAERLAVEFGGSVVSSLESSKNDEYAGLKDFLASISGGRLRVVISTLPSSSGFELPEWLLSGENAKPIVFDVNYKPFQTKLLTQAEAAGSPVVRGSEMLWEQGVGQFELWTGRTAPYHVMRKVVIDNCAEKSEAT